MGALFVISLPSRGNLFAIHEKKSGASCVFRFGSCSRLLCSLSPSFAPAMLIIPSLISFSFSLPFPPLSLALPFPSLFYISLPSSSLILYPIPSRLTSSALFHFTSHFPRYVPLSLSDRSLAPPLPPPSRSPHQPHPRLLSHPRGTYLLHQRPMRSVLPPPRPFRLGRRRTRHAVEQ